MVATTGIINISRCIKDISTLKAFDFTDNNVSNEAADAFISVIESNTALEEISLDSNVFVGRNLNVITKLCSLKFMQVDCKLVTENLQWVDFIFANSNVEDITIKHFAEEMHFLSPSKVIETVAVIKATGDASALHMPTLHSVVMKNKVEMVCTKSNVLVESEIMRLLKAKTVKRLMLAFTKKSCCTDQEIKFIETLITECRNVYSLTIAKLSDNEYSSDVSVIVTVEEDKIIIMLRSESLKKLE